MATDIHLAEFPALLQRWQAEWLAAQGEALREVCEMVQGKVKDGLGDDAQWAELAPGTQAARVAAGFAPDAALLRTGTLRDNIEIAVDGDEACVGVASRVVGDGSRDDPCRDIGDVAVAQEFGDATTPPRPFLGAAAARRLDDVENRLGLRLLDALHRSLPGAGSDGA